MFLKCTKSPIAKFVDRSGLTAVMLKFYNRIASKTTEQKGGMEMGKRNIAILMAVLLVFACWPLHSGAGQAYAAGKPTTIVVMMKEGKELTQEKSGFSIQSIGNQGRIISQNKKYGMYKIEIPAGTDANQVISAYKANPDVKLVDVAKKRHIFSTVTDPLYNEQWGFHAIGAAEARNFLGASIREKLSDITVAVIDTGVDVDHEDLQGVLLPGYNVIDDNNEVDDDNGHGTHVAGIIGAVPNDKGIIGVAGGVKILPIKALDSNGEGYDFEIAIGIREAVDRGADVINLSLGSNEGSELEADAIKYALAHGVVVIGAAGNDGVESVSYPAAYPGVIAVSAIDPYEVIADFSNTGEEIDLAAPGVNILSTVPIELDDDGNPDGYIYYDGTSMAAPMVAGVAALILAQNPNLKNYEVASILTETAKDLGEEGKDDSYGYGMVDALNALETKRLNVSIGEEAEIGQNILLDITVEDGAGAIDPTVTQAVYGYLGKYNKGMDAYEMMQLQDEIIIENGRGSMLLTPDEVGYYKFVATEEVYGDTVGESVYGNSMVDGIAYFIVTPKKPTADKTPGTYTAPLIVNLSTQPQDAEIYYTTDGTDPIDEDYELTDAATLYNGPITLSSSKTIKAIAVKDGIYSTISTFTYQINPPTPPPTPTNPGSGGVGGGGDGGGSIVPQPTSNVKMETDSQGNIKVLLNEEALLKDLEKAETKEYIIDISKEQGEKNKGQEIEIPAKVMEKIKEKGMEIVIQTKDEIIRFSGDVIGAPAKIQFLIQKGEEVKNTKGFKRLSPIYDFTLKADGKIVKNKLNKPVVITIKYDIKESTDHEFLGVYYVNEETGSFEYAGGTADKNQGTVTFRAKHFSKYVVMEHKKTFADIQGIWAQRDIEIVASKQIVNGVSEEIFEPNRNVTRAEFATLLVKALGLELVKEKSKFADVPEDAWYKDPVNTAKHYGLINGIGAAEFAPNQNITREQAAVMIMKAYELGSGRKLDSIVTTMEIRFKDYDQVSQWAKRLVVLADAVGIMKGREGAMFAPMDHTTRAEAAVIVKKLLDSIK